jgi:hypothetical protein
MKKIIFLLLIHICSFQIINSQTQWQRAIGGTNHDYANCIIQTNDGGYAVAGSTLSYSYGYEDMYLVKLNSSGSIQWTKTIGGTGNDIALSVIQTTDGGYALGGHTRPFGAEYYDFYIVKLDSIGSFQWNRTINRANNDYSLSIKQTTDGGFVLAGLSATGGIFSSDIYIVKLNSIGTYQWSKTYGGSNDDVAFSIIQTSEGGLAAAGYTNSFGLGGNNFYILKLDGSGTLQWSRTVGGSGPNGQAYTIIQTTDGGFALAGVTEAFGAGSYDMHIVKLDAGGTLQWTRTVGASGQDWGYSIVQANDGGFVVLGSTNSFGVLDYYTVKLNVNGTPQWSKTYGGSGIEGGNEVPCSIIKTNGGGFVIAGKTNSFGVGGDDMYIVKIDSLGITCGNFSTPPTISGTGGTSGSPSTIVVTQNPTVTTPTCTTGTGGILTIICPPVIIVPAAPLLSAPPNGSYNQTATVRFTWYKSLYAATYRLQVALDSQFTNFAFNDSTLTDSTIVIANLTINKYYWWRVNAKNTAGTSPYSIVWRFGTFLVGVKQIGTNIPKENKLFNNYPNPFNPITNIKFDITTPLPPFRKGGTNVTLKIYDVLGNEISTLVNEQLKPGNYEVEWNGSNYASGVYYYKLIAGEYKETKKMVLIK